MTRFDDILKGKRARRTVPFPEPLYAPSRPDGAPPEAQVVVDLVVLSAEEESRALADAVKFAKGLGIEDPKPDTPLYDLGLMIHTILIGCVDHDSPMDAPAPFFKSAEQVRQGLDRERIAYLYTLQQVWQEDVSPTRKRFDDNRLLELVIDAADEEDPLRFFEKLPPATLARCFRSLAKQHLTLLRARLQGGSSSIDVGTNDSKSTESATSDADGAVH